MFLIFVSIPSFNALRTEVKIKDKLTADGQSINQCVLVSSTFWLPRPNVLYCLTATVMSLWSALPDERSGLSFASQSLQYLVFRQYIHKYLHFI
jgi:hypothetical protein